MNLTREQVLQHLHATHEGTLAWKRSQAALLAEGGEVVSLVIEVLEVELNKADGDVYGVSYQNLLRLAELLAQLEDPRSLAWLLRVSRQTSEHKFYSKTLKTLEKRGSVEDIQALIALMQCTTLRWVGLPFKMKLQSHEFSQIAKALVRIAERDPQPELRAALPLLAYTLSAPIEFIGLHRRLRSALRVENLPIPAVADQGMEDLPIPAFNKEHRDHHG